MAAKMEAKMAAKMEAKMAAKMEAKMEAKMATCSLSLVGDELDICINIEAGQLSECKQFTPARRPKG